MRFTYTPGAFSTCTSRGIRWILQTLPVIIRYGIIIGSGAIIVFCRCLVIVTCRCLVIVSNNIAVTRQTWELVLHGSGLFFAQAKAKATHGTPDAVAAIVGSSRLKVKWQKYRNDDQC
jgi:hypothetical protein